jgi:hypothetical protein
MRESLRTHIGSATDGLFGGRYRSGSTGPRTTVAPSKRSGGHRPAPSEYRDWPEWFRRLPPSIPLSEGQARESPAWRGGPGPRKERRADADLSPPTKGRRREIRDVGLRPARRE